MITGIKVLKINFNSDRNGLINFVFADPILTSAGTPLLLNPQADDGKVTPSLIIVDVNVLDEYVIIKSISKETINLTGWNLTNVGKSKYSFKSVLTIEPGSYIMLLSGKAGESFTRMGIDSSQYKQYSRSMVWSKNEIWDDKRERN